MRELFTIIFLLLILGLMICVNNATRSRKKISRPVGFLLASLIPPITGNLIIICSTDRLCSDIGRYIYFIGMDLVMFALIRFSGAYCNIPGKRVGLRHISYLLLIIDSIQLFCNIFFGHAFGSEQVEVEGAPYYTLVPYAGQTFHRIVDYSILAVIIIIFIIKMITSPRIYLERYAVILITMVICAAWQTLYIFSRSPIDRSMIGFGVFGLLIFYFSLYYRPLRLLDRMLANVASEMNEALFFFDANEKCIWANAPALAFAELTEEELDKVPDFVEWRFEDIKEIHSEEWSAPYEIGKGEQKKYYKLDKHTQRDDRGRVTGSFLRIRDNTEEQKKLQRELYYASHDILTGLYTREFLYEHIHQALVDNPDTDYYIVYVDVKNFKIVNDIFSTAFSDHALRRISKRIREYSTKNWIYGCLGDAAFGVCLPTNEFQDERLERNLSGFIVSDGNHEYHLLIHLGVYQVTDHSGDVSVMFDRAYVAVASISDEYGKHISYYDENLRSKLVWEQHISTQLSDAIANRHINPYLQPIVDGSGKPVGAEALVRWIHPEDGFLSPGSFIPVFEKNGMIVEVDRYMWRCACEILSRWKGELADLFISVNISPKDFYFMDVVSEITGLTEEYGIEPARLRIEITETAMMNEGEDRMKILNEFRKLGFIVEMDDFGSGYSSLNMLKDMPVDVLKIDMKFLSSSDNNDRAKKIVQSIIGLSGELGIESLTEGVETDIQYKSLYEMGCKLYQGYLFSKPVPVEDFEKYCLQKK
ncbi:MAG: bifunctional diguanylate cyclase/phosphodiesterase [Ruminiclostridium sp.]|nr:bifunctional diguanylate cyclase/phosphodiesterase [Ruminiclostridium sp.]